MNKEKYFDEESFLSTIHTIPLWVKNGDDLLRFCKHIQYRLLQSKDMLFWYQMNFKLNEDQSNIVGNIYLDYEKAYNNDKSEFIKFSEMFE